MKYKTALGALLIGTLPLQVIGYAAYAQQASTVDPEFMRNLEAALVQKPELILQAADRAQNRQREAEVQRMSASAVEIRKELAVANNPGFVLGNPAGSKTFIEYLDYRCSYCQRAHGEVNKLIERDPQVRMVVVQLPVLGPDSEALARFAMAADNQSKFKQAHDYLYTNKVEANEEGLKAASAELGLDWAKVQSDMTSAELSARLEANKSLAERMNVNGTPFFITPTTVVPGATTAEVLAKSAA